MLSQGLAFAIASLIPLRLHDSNTGKDDAEITNKQHFLFSKGEDLLSSPGGRVDEEDQDEQVRLLQASLAGVSRQVDPITHHPLKEPTC